MTAFGTVVAAPATVTAPALPDAKVVASTSAAVARTISHFAVTAVTAEPLGLP